MASEKSKPQSHLYRMLPFLVSKKGKRMYTDILPVCICLGCLRKNLEALVVSDDGNN